MTETHYAVETSYSPDGLAYQVNKRLVNGWFLVGSLCTSPHTDKGKAVIVFSQSLSKVTIS